MQAKDIMTKDVYVLKPGTSIAQAIKALVDKAISGAPVVDENKNIIGLVTEKDLIVAYDFSQKLDVPVEDIMSKEVLGVSEQTPVEEISQMLVRKNIKRVPVLEDKKIVGIVSRRDVLRCIYEQGTK